ncbi:MAG: neutral/alkaline non-lysosomal ceramidase N-terminal domain-containing protein [Chloroflexota bacterium]|nr:neutral/alkaline non-lysosomal ceramidase N-terminal domain-containing protein [Chloroflexota bacterium]MDE2841663.1 neutral/alkaline non-lysosomal ceramidase N-terminal domain-containing protein [Chloroflexota bacterium]MDE2930954.1 neutral/alkaline non-lysosomal ceramidase N-terminal domain-containing protein [Chloroflexota bacterium]
MALSIGAAQRTISPPLGTHMAGYYHVRPASAIHDDLFARAMVIDDGETTIALVTCDLVSIREESVVNAREQVEEATHIPGGNVLICCTHTHTGPITRGDRSAATFGSMSETYMATLEEQIAAAVIDAWKTRSPGTLRIGKSQETRIAFNRRFHMRDGSVKTNPGKNNPEVIGPVGPIDPDVYVLLAESDQGDPLGVLVNYSLHADTTGGDQISADYSGWMEKHLKNMSPELDEAVVLYANGYCGDINHVNVNDPNQLKGFEESERIGRALAESTTQALSHLEPLRGETVHASQRIEALPAVIPTAEDIAWAQEAVAATPAGGGPGRDDLVKAHRDLALQELNKRHFDTEVQVLSVGNVAMTALPGEIFVELGLSIKEHSPFEHNLLAELANGNLGYICTAAAYPQGAYEPTSSRVVPGSGEQLVRAALALQREIAIA